MRRQSPGQVEVFVSARPLARLKIDYASLWEVWACIARLAPTCVSVVKGSNNNVADAPQSVPALGIAGVLLQVVNVRA